jgi:hypothetical protein
VVSVDDMILAKEGTGSHAVSYCAKVRAEMVSRPFKGTSLGMAKLPVWMERQVEGGSSLLCTHVREAVLLTVSS